MFKGPGGMGDMMGLMKQAQKMKKDMKKLKKEISKTNITVTNDDNSISLVINGDHLVQKITISEDIDIKDVTVQIIAPDDIELRGDTSYVISLLEKQEPYTVTAEMITPTKDVTMEYTIPVKVLVSYLSLIHI